MKRETLSGSNFGRYKKTASIEGFSWTDIVYQVNVFVNILQQNL